MNVNDITDLAAFDNILEMMRRRGGTFRTGQQSSAPVVTS
jgi:hypothetical protein